MAFQSLLYVLVAFFTFVTSDVAPMSDTAAYQQGQFGRSPNQTFYTANVTSPIFLVDVWDKGSVGPSSHILMNYLTPSMGTGMLFSAEDLSLVWFQDPIPQNVSTVSTVQIQKFQGTDHLTFWAGEIEVGYGDMPLGYGEGSWFLLNSSYDVVHTITTDGLAVGPDLHECRLTDEGTALIMAYNPIPFDLSSVGGAKDDTLLDSVFQDVDIITGKSLFTWHASDHFNLTDSLQPYEKNPHGWDWAHINNIQKTPDGNYIVSLSYCNLITYINGTTGDPIWIMGGTKNQFTDRTTGEAPDFALQHTPTFHDRDLTDLRMFDNRVRKNSYGCTSNCSIARFFTVDITTKSMSSVRQISYPKGLQSMALGNVEPSEGGNAFVNWGFNPVFTEHRPDGGMVLDLRFGVLGGKAIGTYRANKGNWTGHPTTNPSIVVRRQNSSSLETLYVSWNGATEVKCWILLASAAVNPLARATVVDAVPRAGFETAMTVGTPSRYIRAAALDCKGGVLGMSDIWDRENNSTVRAESQWQFNQHNCTD